ncbi:similar to ribosomal protein L11 methyltransferase [Klebsormidium nitens]|uniref:ETFB lysine methyltransferase n=1 Tax=Klebsormidium nitens TaxID=105231 RepID=A0A1Y1HMR2_KLENI|nr:similar to ribosomal protein L11 methyltransferase [Klebsormidium nitens]|eukprot:GAQ78479.1 similar to ribosomal protein L11 methyltransferase [Klebsormidium nitens]
MQAAKIYVEGDNADALCDALLGCGAASCSIEDANLDQEGEEEIYSGPEPWGSPADMRLWEKSAVTALFPADVSIKEALEEAAEILGLPGPPQYDVSMTKDQDWVETIKASYQPVEISRGLWVIPSWCEPIDPGAINVFLEPGVAFGTGDHPTTRLCLAWIRSVVKGGERVMDYGIGSGILAIAAVKLGAAQAVGVDIDPLSITASRHNAERNGLKPETLRVYLADRESAGNPLPENISVVRDSDEAKGGVGAFDIVVANILLNPLVALAKTITGYAKPGAVVGLSGVLEEQVPRVVRTYEEYLEDIQVTTEDGWACVTGRRR